MLEQTNTELEEQTVLSTVETQSPRLAPTDPSIMSSTTINRHDQEIREIQAEIKAMSAKLDEAEFTTRALKAWHVNNDDLSTYGPPNEHPCNQPETKDVDHDAYISESTWTGRAATKAVISAQDTIEEHLRFLHYLVDKGAISADHHLFKRTQDLFVEIKAEKWDMKYGDSIRLNELKGRFKLLEDDTANAVDPTNVAVHNRLWEAFEAEQQDDAAKRSAPSSPAEKAQQRPSRRTTPRTTPKAKGADDKKRKAPAANVGTPGKKPTAASATDPSDRFGDPEYSPGPEHELMYNNPAGVPAFDIERYKKAYPHPPKPLGEAASAAHKALMDATPFPDDYETWKDGAMPKIQNRTDWGNAGKALKDMFKAMFEHRDSTGPHRLPLGMTCQNYIWGKNVEGDMHMYSVGTTGKVVRFYIEHGIIPEPWEVFPAGSLYVNSTLGCPSPGMALENIRVGDWIKFLEAWKIYTTTASEQTAAMPGSDRVTPTRPPEIDPLRARAKEIDQESQVYVGARRT